MHKEETELLVCVLSEFMEGKRGTALRSKIASLSERVRTELRGIAEELLALTEPSPYTMHALRWCDEETGRKKDSGRLLRLVRKECLQGLTIVAIQRQEMKQAIQEWGAIACPKCLADGNTATYVMMTEDLKGED
jgi:hypothetical protein